MAKKKGGKDKITGLYLESIDQGIIRSDETFQMTYDDIIQSGAPLTGDSKYYPVTYEFELSRKHLILTVKDAEGGLNRGMYSGKFKFKGDKLKSAKIKSYAERYRMPDEDGFNDGGRFYKHQTKEKVTTNLSIGEWQMLLVPDFNPNSRMKASFHCQFGSSDCDGKKSPITSVAGGNVLSDVWWQNPFGQDLI